MLEKRERRTAKSGECKQVKMSLRGAKEIPSLCSEQAAQYHKINCHCEERSDATISTFFMRLPRSLRSLTMTYGHFNLRTKPIFYI